MDESKLDKIQKLLAKAERAGTPEESDTFFAKAQELMSKWSIDAAMLASTRKEKAKVVHKQLVINKSGLWKSNLTLLTCIARPNDVQTVITQPRRSGEKPVAHLIGFESDVENVEMLYASMLVQNARMRKQMIPPYLKTQTEKVPWIRSFIEGFGVRIGQRLQEAKDLAETTYGQETYGNSMALVLVSKKQQVAEEMKNLFPHLGKMRGGKRKVDLDGMYAGRSAADRADIGNKRVANSRKALGR